MTPQTPPSPSGAEPVAVPVAEPPKVVDTAIPAPVVTEQPVAEPPAASEPLVAEPVKAAAPIAEAPTEVSAHVKVAAREAQGEKTKKPVGAIAAAVAMFVILTAGALFAYGNMK